MAKRGCKLHWLLWNCLAARMFLISFDLSCGAVSPCYKYLQISEGSLEVKCPAIWTAGKAEVGRVREGRRKKVREDKGRRKKIAREKVEKSRNTMFFQCFVAPEDRKANGANTTCSDHFWKLRCRKFSGRRCAKHISKWKCKELKKTHHVRTAFARSSVVLCIFKNHGRRVTVEEILQRCMPRGRRSPRDIFIRDGRSSGR